MTNKKYFIGNWKMYGDFNSFKIIKKINQFCSNSKKYKVVLCVPNTLIHFFNKKLKSKNIYLGAQNCHHTDTYGAYTGSVSAYMLKKTGAEYIILGHSENRQSGDTNSLIKKKIETSLKQKLNIIFCIGENFSERKNKKTLIVLRKQINYCIEKNLSFLLSSVEVAMPNTYMIFENLLEQLNDIDGIVCYSMFQLHHDKKLRMIS